MCNRRSFRWPAVALLAAVSSASAATALAATSPDEARSEPARPAGSLEANNPDVPGGFDERMQAIDENLKTRKTPIWAGKYYQGDGLGANIRLSLAPEAGAAVTWHGCLGLYGANHAAVVEGADGVLRMSFVAPNSAKEFANFPDELVPVAWGERQYLIPPGEMASFVSAINHGSEPRKRKRGFFLLRDGDDAKPVTGLPALPASTPARVRSVAVEVRVESVKRLSRKQDGKFCMDRYALRIAPVAPAEPPLFVGEELTTLGGDYESVEVTALQGSSADAEMSVFACDAAKAPKPGKRFTTGAYQEKRDRDE